MQLREESKLFLDGLKSIGFAQGDGAFFGKSIDEVYSIIEEFKKNSTPIFIHPDVKQSNSVISHGDFQTEVRIYRPTKSNKKSLPALIYFHGGGWVLGNLDTSHNQCQNICLELNCIVISVDYKLAPQYQFPYLPFECSSITKYFHENASKHGIISTKIAVGGDSSGGNLAAVIPQLLKNTIEISAQVLIYPVTDLRCQSESYAAYSQGFALTAADMKWFIEKYVPNQLDRVNPMASPLLQDDLSGLPPALFLLAEYDPLAAEGLQYANSLQNAHVHVEIDGGKGLIHNFFGMTDAFPNESAEGRRKVVQFLNKIWR